MHSTITDDYRDLRPGQYIEVLPGTQCVARVETDSRPNPNSAVTTQCGREMDHSGPHCAVGYSGLVRAVEPWSPSHDGSVKSTPAVSDASLKYCRRIAHVVEEFYSVVTNLEHLRFEIERDLDADTTMSKHEKDAILRIVQEIRTPYSADIESPIDFENKSEWPEILDEFASE